MTRKSGKEGRQDGQAGLGARLAGSKALATKIALSRLALVWERAWPPLAWMVCVVAVFAGVSLADLWRMVPVGAHIFALGAFGLAIFLGAVWLAR
ncbi:MAG: DUF4175 family protein, partial [Alphaproteobacteria bacterium]